MSESSTNKEENANGKKVNSNPAAFNSLLEPFNLFGWRPSTELSLDENYMDLVLLASRNSICMQGHMACIIVDPRKIETPSTADQLERSMYNAIVAIKNNTPLFSDLNSDVHAEVCAIGQACRLGRATEGCTAYITMPPCKRCFAAVLTAGIKRIVSRRPFIDTVLPVAKKYEIELVVITDTPAQTRRIQSLATVGDQEGERSAERQAEIDEQRKRRKEETAKRKAAKRKRQEEDPAFQKPTKKS